MLLAGVESANHIGQCDEHKHYADKEPQEQPLDNRQATYYIEPDKRPFQ